MTAALACLAIPAVLIPVAVIHDRRTGRPEFAHELRAHDYGADADDALDDDAWTASASAERGAR